MRKGSEKYRKSMNKTGKWPIESVPRAPSCARQYCLTRPITKTDSVPRATKWRVPDKVQSTGVFKNKTTLLIHVGTTRH